MKKVKLVISLFLIITLIMTNFSASVFAKKPNNNGIAPVVSNLSISGNLVVGQTLTGQYTYYDANGDLQGASKYRWLYSSALSGPFYAINGATAKTYTLISSDTGKYLKFEVTPVSATGTPNAGSAVQSSPVGPITSPVIQNSKIVLGFATKYYSTDVSSYNSMVANSKSIDQIATVTYTADSLGNLSGTAPQDQISYANSNGIKPLALITNSDSNGFNGSIAKSILENSVNKQNLINNIVNALKQNSYSGVNIDFEGVLVSDRSYYSQFIKDIKNALSPLGYITTVSVPAKTNDSLTNTWTGAYDYAAIGASADQVILMTYDEHGSWGAIGPVASIGWVTNVINYAKTVIPTNKILLGLAAYGYDWSSTGNKAVSLNQVYNLVNTYGGTISWDIVSQSPYYIYTVNGIQHTIWFENGDSISYKLDLVNQNNLLGVAIWRLGLENTAYWNIINNKLI